MTSFFVVVARAMRSWTHVHTGDPIDIGFCTDQDLALKHRPPRPQGLPYDRQGYFSFKDRFFLVRPVDFTTGRIHGVVSRIFGLGSKKRREEASAGFEQTEDTADDVFDRAGMIGWVEVSERKVECEMQRTSVRRFDYTGLGVDIKINRKQYNKFREYMNPWDDMTFDGKGSHGKMYDQFDSENTVVIFRIPSALFSFPMPRGSETPWDDRNTVGELARIKKFYFSRIEIQMLRDEQGRPLTVEEAVGEARSALRPALSLTAT